MKYTPQGTRRKATPKLWSALGPTQANQQQIDTADQEGSSKFVTLKRYKNQTKEPPTTSKEITIGWRKTKRHTSKATPKLLGPARENQNPKLNITKTLI